MDQDCPERLDPDPDLVPQPYEKILLRKSFKNLWKSDKKTWQNNLLVVYFTKLSIQCITGRNFVEFHTFHTVFEFWRKGQKCYHCFPGFTVGHGQIIVCYIKQGFCIAKYSLLFVNPGPTAFGLAWNILLLDCFGLGFGPNSFALVIVVVSRLPPP